MTLIDEIATCRLCADRFAATHTAHSPRPVVWFRPEAKLLIAGQAPGMRVHNSGKPFDDPSGNRLRQWLGIDADEFYDMSRVAIVPMAFCFPGYDAQGRDLQPPRICGQTWHKDVMTLLTQIRLTVLVGGHAMRWHLGTRAPVSKVVANWRDYSPRIFPLPHPSWRNTAWLKRNPWFERDLLPPLRKRVRKVLNDD